MLTKYTHNGVDFVIIYNKDITDYYVQPFADMYNDLSAIKKDEYTIERIVVTAYGTTDEGIWKHFLNIVKTIDIPIFFITVKTNCTYTKQLVEKLCGQIIPYENTIKVTIDSTNLKQTPINNKFDYSGLTARTLPHGKPHWQRLPSTSPFSDRAPEDARVAPSHAWPNLARCGDVLQWPLLPCHVEKTGEALLHVLRGDAELV